MTSLPTRSWGDPGAPRRALLVHGVVSSASSWWRVGEHLADAGWSVTAVDLPGHGDADAVDSYSFAAYAESLPPGPWQLAVGHSLGGSIVVERCAAEPEWADRVALIEPVLAIASADLDSVMAAQVAELDLTAERIAAEHPDWDARDVEAKAEASARARPAAVARTFLDNSPWNLLERASGLRAPTLAVGGDPSVHSMVPDAIAARLAAIGAHVAVARIRNAGHSPHRDAPAATLALLDDWLARTEGARPAG